MVGSQDSQAVLDGGYEAGLSFVGQGVIVRAPLGNDVVRVAELAAQALSKYRLALPIAGRGIE